MVDVVVQARNFGTTGWKYRFGQVRVYGKLLSVQNVLWTSWYPLVRIWLVDQTQREKFKYSVCKLQTNDAQQSTAFFLSNAVANRLSLVTTRVEAIKTFENRPTVSIIHNSIINKQFSNQQLSYSLHFQQNRNAKLVHGVFMKTRRTNAQSVQVIIIKRKKC